MTVVNKLPQTIFYHQSGPAKPCGAHFLPTLRETLRGVRSKAKKAPLVPDLGQPREAALKRTILAGGLAGALAGALRGLAGAFGRGTSGCLCEQAGSSVS